MTIAGGVALLLVAKAPVTGRVKTRLGRTLGMERAADLAAAALLDTVATCTETFGAARCHLAIDGDLALGQRAEELSACTAGWTVFPQVGDSFGQRLVRAHQDAHAASSAAVVQIGMDTPQVSSAQLRHGEAMIHDRHDAVLGPALDGGWWLLGVGGPHLLTHLADVPMSTPRTGELTRSALGRAGARVSEIETLQDVDEVEDAAAVAAQVPGSRFATAWAELRPGR